jgi:hypothetical protein
MIIPYHVPKHEQERGTQTTINQNKEIEVTRIMIKLYQRDVNENYSIKNETK